MKTSTENKEKVDRLNEDLENAAEEYANSIAQFDMQRIYSKDDFKAGWKACREQMMKDATIANVIESFNPVSDNEGPVLRGVTLIFPDKNALYLIAGDKVKLIIVKEGI